MPDTSLLFGVWLFGFGCGWICITAIDAVVRHKTRPLTVGSIGPEITIRCDRKLKTRTDVIIGDVAPTIDRG